MVDNITELIELGKTHRAEHRFHEAIEALRRASVIAPRNEHIHFELGNVYAAIRETALAQGEFEETLQINPSHAAALFELGKIHLIGGDADKAQEFFGKAAHADPGNPHIHTERGKLFRRAGNYLLSRAEFAAASSNDPGNVSLQSWSKRADEVLGSRKEQSPYRVFFTWGMHYACNYNCSYCYTPKPESSSFPKDHKYQTTYRGVREVVKAWENIAQRYGSCRIRMDGGEPSMYPKFPEIVRELSAMHYLQMKTNLSFDVDNFVQWGDPARVRIDASFHCEHILLAPFLAKLKTLKENNFKVIVSFVTYPPLMRDVEVYKSAIEELGVPFIIHPFSGEYQGKRYPDNYSKTEAVQITAADHKSVTELDWRKEDAVAKEKKQCRMGQMYARIYPDGSVYRCCTADGLTALGNIYDGSFALLDEPASCDNEHCRCWRCMVVGEESRWLHTWLDDWELP